MNIQPLSIFLTVIGGLLVAGLLGWVRRPRLVVFVPRLFSHSRISDKGQIAEISIMDRGFKTEENIELSLNPSMHYELIGSNNLDTSLVKSKLIIPRIGSSDDCSVLLQVENGTFTHTEIVNCLSKETKASVTTKLEEVPITAPQRVYALVFLGIAIFLGLFILKTFGYISFANPATINNDVKIENTSVDSQGWAVGSIYKDHDNILYQDLIKRGLVISTGSAKVQKNMVIVPISAQNKTSYPITINVSLIGAENRTRLSDLLIFPGDTVEKSVELSFPADKEKRKMIVELFVESSEGTTMSARKIIEF